jgi:Laminin G domain
MRVRRGALALAISVAAACGDDPDPVPQPPRPDLLLSFDAGSLTAAANSGTRPVTLDSHVFGGGEIEEAAGPDGSPALRFPAFDETEPALAAVTVVATEGDFLSPGASDFEFGVDFSLDEQSEGGADNGNNLVQRGLFDDAVQYKLQIDHGLVSCRVRGSAGEAVVESAEPVTPGAWYRVRCARRGDALTLRIGALDGSGEVSDYDVADTVTPTGEVTLAAESPLSIGAKVLRTGEVVPSSPDQFNGALDNVLYTRLTSP